MAGVAEGGHAEGALQDVARPAISSAAMMFCQSSRFTGHPCDDCMQIAAGVVHAFLRALPPLWFLPSELDAAIRSGEKYMATHAGVLSAAKLLCDAVSEDGVGEPCPGCLKTATVVIYRFLLELPETRFLPASMARDVVIHSMHS